jgi:hypothetical protein
MPTDDPYWTLAEAAKWLNAQSGGGGFPKSSLTDLDRAIAGGAVGLFGCVDGAAYAKVDPAILAAFQLVSKRTDATGRSLSTKPGVWIRSRGTFPSSRVANRNWSAGMANLAYQMLYFKEISNARVARADMLNYFGSNVATGKRQRSSPKMDALVADLEKLNLEHDRKGLTCKDIANKVLKLRAQAPAGAPDFLTPSDSAALEKQIERYFKKQSKAP